MSTVDATSVKNRAVAGAKALTLRTLISILLRMASSLCLARLLFPKDYGLFGVAAYLTGLGMYLSDIGLAGALIRQQKDPTADETITVFVCQQVITGCIVGAIFIANPLLLHMYHLSPAAALLLKVMAIGLFFSSLRIVPMMALERNLAFPAIARCELIENLVQTISTILLAYFGCGPWALAGGGLLRGAVGLTCVWAASPWRPHGNFRFAIVRRLARYGIAFQLNAIMPSILNGWMPLAVSRILGVAALGFVNWAINLSSIPSMLSNILYRVAFPAYSRLQSDPQMLRQYLYASLQRVMILMCLIVPAFVLTVPVIVPLLFRSRWVPAVPLVQWFSFESILLTLTMMAIAAQNASGRAAERLAVAIGIGLGRAGMGYVAVRHWGMAGIGPATCLVSFGELTLTLFLVGRELSETARLLNGILKPLLASSAILAASAYVEYTLPFPLLILKVALALGLFAGLIVIYDLLSQERVFMAEVKQASKMVRLSRFKPAASVP